MKTSVRGSLHESGLSYPDGSHSVSVDTMGDIFVYMSEL